MVSLIISRTCVYDFQGRNKSKHNTEEQMTHPHKKKKKKGGKAVTNKVLYQSAHLDSEC